MAAPSDAPVRTNDTARFAPPSGAPPASLGAPGGAAGAVGDTASASASSAAAADADAQQDITTFVHSMLDQMHDRFGQMSSSIITRIDEMSSRIGELETAIRDIMDQADLAAETDGTESGAPTASGVASGGAQPPRVRSGSS